MKSSLAMSADWGSVGAIRMSRMWECGGHFGAPTEEASTFIGVFG